VASELVVRGGGVVTPHGELRADVHVRGHRIAAIGGDQPTPGAAVLDATGLLVAPGFLDLQCNGGYGIDLATQPERVLELAGCLSQHGVTSFLPTLVSAPTEVVRRAIGVRREPSSGANVLGWHLEGPMLAPARGGAHRRDQLRAITADELHTWRPPNVAMVTLAPELPGALDAIRALHGSGVVVAAGHTDATTDQFVAGVEAGVRVLTHLFNAMPPLLHRAPGPVGIALTDARVRAGMIVDGHHVHRAVVAVAWAALGGDRLVLVSDAVAPMGMTPGTIEFGDTMLVSDGETVRTEDGTLAGSVLPLDRALRNLVAFTGCDPLDALRSATSTPADVIGATTKGRIEPDADADLVLLDSTLHVVATVVGGRVVHDPDGRLA
jgi:N-acetylglucosamine-6-phosphate deacetylase